MKRKLYIINEEAAFYWLAQIQRLLILLVFF